MRIKTGAGSLISNDLSLNEEEADRAVAALLARARKAVADRKAANQAMQGRQGDGGATETWCQEGPR
ncbi:hypothetical protein ACVWWH_003531 [Sinomonas sp. RB5]